MLAEKENNRILYFDILRIIACFAVITIHLCAQWFDILTLQAKSWMVLNIYDGFARAAVPIFVMISGALFLNPEKNVELSVLLKKNVLRIAVAFVFWSGVYSIMDRLQGVRMRDIMFGFLSGHNHLWFLYMIAGLYLVTPLLRKLTESEKLIKYFLILWFLFSVLLTTAEAGVSYFKSYFPHWIDVIQEAANVNLVTGYVGYYVLGHFLHRREFSRKERCVIYTLGILGAASTVVFTYLYSRRTGALDMSFYNNMALGVMLESTAIFVFFKYHAPQQKDNAFQKLITAAAICSFGIYLVHMLVIQIVQKVLPFELNVRPLAVFIPIYAVAVFLISFAITFILKKIPSVNRFIV